MDSEKSITQLDIELNDGSSIHVDKATNGDVLLAVQPPGTSVTVVRLNPAVAAYLAGQLAVRAGVRLG